MELGHLNQSLYPRAVSPTVEGKLRQDGGQRGVNPEYAASGQKAPASAVRRDHGQRIQRDGAQRRMQDERAIHRHSREQEQEFANYTHAAAYGDRMAVASRQARQTHHRRSYSPPALVSARGREANRRYLDTSVSQPARIIDEVV